MKAHPLSELFPLMDGDELQTLVADIKENGLREPVVTYDGMILDGRNRWAACKKAGVKQVQTVPYEGDSPLSYVISANLHRRHLSVSQRAMIAAEMAKLEDGQTKAGAQICAPDENGQPVTQDEAAEALNVSKRTVQKAKKVLKKGTKKQIDKVKSGEVTVEAAAAEIDKQDKVKNKPAPPVDLDDPPLDVRFMPNAAEAAALAEHMRNLKARLVAVRTDIRKHFPDRHAVMAKRINLGDTDATLTELIETIDRNLPEHVCPTCCGTGTDDAGKADKYCDGYGVIDRHHHAGLKAKWKHTRARYQSLLEEAGE